jgi:hypothetical protein
MVERKPSAGGGVGHGRPAHRLQERREHARKGLMASGLKILLGIWADVFRTFKLSTHVHLRWPTDTKMVARFELSVCIEGIQWPDAFRPSRPVHQ